MYVGGASLWGWIVTRIIHDRYGERDEADRNDSSEEAREKRRLAAEGVR